MAAKNPVTKKRKNVSDHEPDSSPPRPSRRRRTSRRPAKPTRSSSPGSYASAHDESYGAKPRPARGVTKSGASRTKKVKTSEPAGKRTTEKSITSYFGPRQDNPASAVSSPSRTNFRQNGSQFPDSAAECEDEIWDSDDEPTSTPQYKPSQIAVSRPEDDPIEDHPEDELMPSQQLRAPSQKKSARSAELGRLCIASKAPSQKKSTCISQQPGGLQIAVSKHGANEGRRHCFSKSPSSTIGTGGPAFLFTEHSPGVIPQVDPRPWPERYAPKSAADLAVHQLKVREVRDWLKTALSNDRHRRLLVIQGPAGAGKTATIEVLSKELNFELLEWRNPQSVTGGEEYGEEGPFSAGLSGVFEDFMMRATKFNSLELVSSRDKLKPNIAASIPGRKKKVILIEEFPNILYTSSPLPMRSFRNTIKTFLERPSDGLPPLVILVSEPTFGTDRNAFTAHRLLSAEILGHRRTRTIKYNAIAETFMLKALKSVLAQDAVATRRIMDPSDPVLKTLSSAGDIRSALMSLEFLAANAQRTGGRIPTAKGKKKAATKLTKSETLSLQAVTQREISVNMFNAIGKVVYNKRYGDDKKDEYRSAPIPPISSHPYHKSEPRNCPDSLIDSCGTDPATFIAGIHENYPMSCNTLSGLPAGTSTLDVVNSLLDNLSDADLLSSLPYGHLPFSHDDTPDTASIRVDELAFHVAVRGTMLALPSPVHRGSAHIHMFYPMSARLWKPRQEASDTVEWLMLKGVTGQSGGGRVRAVVETLPYLGVIARKYEDRRRRFGNKGLPPPLPEEIMSAVNRVTKYNGVGPPSKEFFAEEYEEDEEVGITVDKATHAKEESPDKEEGKDKTGIEEKQPFASFWAQEEDTEKLVLSDDDIEDF